jgi:hypothetical protein
MTKQCKNCGETKDSDAFYRRPRHDQYKDSSAGYSTKCRICVNLERKEHRKANRKRVDDIGKNSRLKRVYGIDLNQYNEMFAAQNGCCKGCKRHQSQFKKSLVVDHSHSTGAVRGLLCTPCNLILGYARDSQETLVNLMIYIEESKPNKTILPVQAAMKVG